MARFIQLHLLTSYPPSNLNRDDIGRPKTAIVGGVLRLRVSSQSLKRHWRTSSLFQERLRGNLGDRTKDLGPRVYKALTDGGMDPEKAEAILRRIAEERVHPYTGYGGVGGWEEWVRATARGEKVKG